MICGEREAYQLALAFRCSDTMLDFLHEELGMDTNLANVIEESPCDTYLFAKAALGIYFDEEDRSLVSFLEHLRNRFPSNASTELMWDVIEKNVRRWMFDKDKDCPHNTHTIWPRLAVAESIQLRHESLEEERKVWMKEARKGKKRGVE